MTLAELTTPYKRRRIIEYGADGNKAVRHWYEVQQVGGTIYKSKDNNDGMFILAVFLDDKHDGYCVFNMIHAEQYRADRIMEQINLLGCTDLESMVARCCERMDYDYLIGNVEIEFLRQFNPVFADTCAKYRLDFYERKHAESEKRRKEQEEQAAAEKARQQAELEAEKAKYLGWADNMAPMRFGNVNTVLSKRVRYNGKSTTRRGFVIELIRDGYMPEQNDDVTSWYGGKWEPRQSKPKTEYYLSKDNLSYKITKTEFDFASYLVSHKEAKQNE